MDKRYYWLKLKDDFFEDETIKLLKEMDNGKDYIIFLLQLRLKAINTDGYLSFKGLMPYNEKMLATITGTNVDIVKSALKIFQEIGLMDKLDDGTLYMKHIEELIGSEGSSAKRMREHREKLQLLPEKASQCDSDVQYSDIEIEIDKELEKDTDTEKEIKKSSAPKKVKARYAEFVSMTVIEYDKLIEQYGDAATKRMIEILDNYKGSKGKVYKDDYRAILSWVVDRYKQESGNKETNGGPRKVYR